MAGNNNDSCNLYFLKTIFTQFWICLYYCRCQL